MVRINTYTLTHISMDLISFGMPYEIISISIANKNSDNDNDDDNWSNALGYTQKISSCKIHHLAWHSCIFRFSTPLTYIFGLVTTDYFCLSHDDDKDGDGIDWEEKKETKMDVIILVFLTGVVTITWVRKRKNSIVDWWWFVQKSKLVRKTISIQEKMEKIVCGVPIVLNMDRNLHAW